MIHCPITDVTNQNNHSSCTPGLISDVGGPYDLHSINLSFGGAVTMVFQYKGYLWLNCFNKKRVKCFIDTIYIYIYLQ